MITENKAGTTITFGPGLYILKEPLTFGAPPGGFVITGVCSQTAAPPCQWWTRRWWQARKARQQWLAEAFANAAAERERLLRNPAYQASLAKLTARLSARGRRER